MPEPKSFFLTAALSDYLLAHSTPIDEAQRWLIEKTATSPQVPEVMRTSAVSPEQGAFMTLITRLVGARSAIEVGTFTGYSSLCIARGLRPGGRLLCCDISEEWTAIARAAWAKAGVAERIELRLAPAIDTLRALPHKATLDLAFIDADKASYAAYYEEILSRLRPDGLILVDNTLWRGDVLDPTAATDPEAAEIRAFNDMVAADDRVESMILTIGDGLTLIRKRETGRPGILRTFTRRSRRSAGHEDPARMQSR
jgi:caffeoyl-CoA O-methyltransferase